MDPQCAQPTWSCGNRTKTRRARTTKSTCGPLWTTDHPRRRTSTALLWSPTQPMARILSRRCVLCLWPATVHTTISRSTQISRWCMHSTSMGLCLITTRTTAFSTWGWIARLVTAPGSTHSSASWACMAGSCGLVGLWLRWRKLSWTATISIDGSTNKLCIMALVFLLVWWRLSLSSRSWSARTGTCHSTKSDTRALASSQQLSV